MKILVTGAFGNLGIRTVKRLIDNGHEVTSFDLDTAKNIKNSKKFKDLKKIWGDTRDRQAVKRAVGDNQAVIHLAFVIPPESEKNPEKAWDINVEGTKNVISAIKDSEVSPKMIFASSVSVYGISTENPPRKCTDPVQPTDSYSHHKVVCEHLIRISKIRYSILRLGAILSLDLTELDPLLFQVPLDNRIELIHIDDAARAFAGSVDTDDILGKTLLIGGGKKCQMLQKDFIKRVLDVIGIGMLPKDAFSLKAFYIDWLDTSLSQELLDYQYKGLDDYIEDLKGALGIKRYFIKVFQPFAKYFLLKKSPFFIPRNQNSKKRTNIIRKHGFNTH